MTLSRGYFFLTIFILGFAMSTQERKSDAEELRSADALIKGLTEELSKLSNTLVQMESNGKRNERHYVDLKVVHDLLHIDLDYVKSHRNILAKLAEIRQSEANYMEHFENRIEKIVWEEEAARKKQLQQFNLRNHMIDNDRARMEG